MTTPNDPAFWLLARLLAVVVLGAAAGCQTAPYTAGALPPGLLAKPLVSQRAMQLGGLAAGGQNSTRIAPGDLLEVHLTSGAEEKPPEPLLARVSEDGMLDVPIVGAVRVAGFEPAGASRMVAAAAVERGVYKRPSATITVKEQATNQVMVLGAVNKPGQYRLPKYGSDVLSAIAAAGGLTEEAGLDVEVMRHDARRFAEVESTSQGESQVQPVSFAAPGPLTAAMPDVQRIDLSQASAQASQARPLGDHDVVMVLPKEKRVIHVMGLVTRPDQFEMPDDQPIRLLDAIAMAGGRSSQVADKVIVLRQPEEGAEPVAISASLSAAKRNSRENLVLAPGDLVSVETTVATATVQSLKDFFRVTMGVSSRLTAF